MPHSMPSNFGEVRSKERDTDRERRADRRPLFPAIDSKERQNAELQNRIDLLEEEIRLIKKALMPRLLFPLKWNLNRGETTVLACLYTSANGFRSNELLRAVAILSDAADGNTLAPVRIFCLRNKLRPFGIRIVNRHSEGYILPPDAHALIKAALKEESE
jgi:hypothetical protein